MKEKEELKENVEVRVDESVTEEVSTSAQEEQSEDLGEVKVEATEETDEEKEAYALKLSEEDRLKLIKDFNDQNKGVAYIEEGVPTKEEVDAVIQEFVKANDDYAHMQFTIADAANSLRVAKFLKNWNEKDAVWEKDMWQGTIFFDSIIKDFIERREKDETLPLVVNYGALSYLFLSMGNVRGVGLKAAIYQKTINEEYDKIFGVIADCVEDFKAQGKEVERLKKTAQFYSAGFRVHFEEEPKDNGRMSKEELVQNIKDHWDETEDLREKIYANPGQFGFTNKDVEELKAWRDEQLQSAVSVGESDGCAAPKEEETTEEKN